MQRPCDGLILCSRSPPTDCVWDYETEKVAEAQQTGGRDVNNNNDNNIYIVDMIASSVEW
jgi:hypothetical protein